MATYVIPRDPFRWFVVGARVLLSACAVALVSCGGGQSGPAAPVDSVAPAGADTTDETGIALNPPARVGESNRIEVTWQAQGDLTTFTVLVQRAASLGFEAVNAIVGNNSAQFTRGPAYRLDFPTASVRVRGCDASNQCVDSNAQPLLDVLLTGVAQVAPNIQPLRSFGHDAALSADGNTLAAGSTENDPNQPGQYAVRIFQRGDDGRWVQEARLERFAIQASFAPLALSGDGQTLVVGAYDHTGTVGGINAPEASAPPAPTGQHLEWTGAIHVFVRDRQQRQWSRQAFIKATEPVAGEALGFRVAVSHDGNRALAASFHAMYLFERTNGQWRQARIFDSSSGAIDPSVGMALSADGRSIAVKESATYPEPLPQSVTVYKECQCSEGWRPVARLSSARPPPDIRFPDDGDAYGRSLSFSSDGNVLAVGAPFDSGDEACDGTTMNAAAPAAGAVYVFAADSSGVWQRRALLKARTALHLDQLGGEVALSGDGKVLAAKACGLGANAQGLRRNHRADATIGQQPGDSPCSSYWGGTAYVFEESPAGAWSHTAAEIPAPGELVALDSFSLALSADAQTLALGLNSFLSGGGISGRVQVY